MADALHVKCFVDVFEEGKAHNAVICALVFCESGAAELGGLVVGAVDAGGVEYFVDAEICMLAMYKGQEEVD